VIWIQEDGVELPSSQAGSDASPFFRFFFVQSGPTQPVPFPAHTQRVQSGGESAAATGDLQFAVFICERDREPVGNDDVAHVVPLVL
jgi:hypothetical protein